MEVPISDEELTELALSSDPHAPLAADAVPLVFGGMPGIELLPSWYMPPVVAMIHHRWWRPVVLALVFGFVIIEAAGLCSTYGSLVVP